MTESATIDRPLVILGCGYVGTRIAKAALAQGRPLVRACRTKTPLIAALGPLGAELKHFDASQPKTLAPALSGVRNGTVVYSVPTGRLPQPPGRAVRDAMGAAAGAGAECFIYFSSSGLYGDRPDDDVWIDESTPLALDDPPMKNFHSDEEELLRSEHRRMRTVILRLAPVYGPGKGVRARLRKGDYTLLDDGQHAISRIHLDDVVNVVFAAEARAPHGSVYLVADDQPTTQLEYATWLTERLGLPMPGSRALYDPGRRAQHRNRRIKNTKLKTELELVLRYPTFREGEAAIEAEEVTP